MTNRRSQKQQRNQSQSQNRQRNRSQKQQRNQKKRFPSNQNRSRNQKQQRRNNRQNGGNLASYRFHKEGGMLSQPSEFPRNLPLTYYGTEDVSTVCNPYQVSV